MAIEDSHLTAREIGEFGEIPPTPNRFLVPAQRWTHALLAGVRRSLEPRIGPKSTLNMFIIGCCTVVFGVDKDASFVDDSSKTVSG